MAIVIDKLITAKISGDDFDTLIEICDQMRVRIDEAFDKGHSDKSRTAATIGLGADEMQNIRQFISRIFEG